MTRCPDALLVRPTHRAAVLRQRLCHRARLYHLLPRGVFSVRSKPGFSKVSRNIDAAARTLGATISETLLAGCICRLLRPALGAAALLVFVVLMKELPATLLLRPFNFDTLATQVFTLASLYRYEEAGLSALTIVVVSLAPVAPPPWRHCRRPPGRRAQPAQRETRVFRSRDSGLVGKDRRRQRHEAIKEGASNAREIVGPYPLIYADPPWKCIVHSELGKEMSSSENHYQLIG